MNRGVDACVSSDMGIYKERPTCVNNRISKHISYITTGGYFNGKRKLDYYVY